MGEWDGIVSSPNRRYPIVAGAVVGLLVGVAGILVSTALAGTPVGGFTGAVACGITTVYLSRASLADSLVNAVVADLLSSIAFVVLVLVTYLTYVSSTEGLSMLGAALFTYVYMVFGVLGVAVPVGLLSIVLTVTAGTITAHVMDRTDAATTTS